jgi:hypothetical protein
LAWQGWPEDLQLPQPAVTSGPWRLPHVSELPLEVEVELELDEELDIEPPHTSVLGMQSWSWSPLAPETAMQLRSEEQARALPEQSGAQ